MVQYKVTLSEVNNLPALSSLEGVFKFANGPSPLCFLLRPPGGAGSAARTSLRLLVLSSPAGRSGLPGDRAESLEDVSSTGALLVTLNSESWRRGVEMSEHVGHTLLHAS